MVYDPRTNAYIDRHKTEGLTKKEAVRCLKRYVAREVFNLLPHEELGLDSPIGASYEAPQERKAGSPCCP